MRKKVEGTQCVKIPMEDHDESMDNLDTDMSPR